MGHLDAEPVKAPTATRPTRVRYLVLAAVCSLAVLTYVQRQGFLANTKAIKEDLGLDSEQFGYMASVWLVAYGIFQVPCGLLGDRLGARHVLTVLVVGWSLLLAIVALTVVLPPGGWLAFTFLLVLRFLFGAFRPAASRSWPRGGRLGASPAARFRPGSESGRSAAWAASWLRCSCTG